MFTALLLCFSLFLLHASSTYQTQGHHGRRVCVGGVRGRHVSFITESFLQPVHKPYITMCQNHRACSTYKTIYRVSYRQVSRVSPNLHTYPECCPGWRRMHSHNCNQAVCEQSCANGGTCVRPNHCMCPRGWTGRSCKTDVDECKEVHGCSQKCVNTPGSFECLCEEGFRLDEDRKKCLRIRDSEQQHSSRTNDGGGLARVENVTEEVQILKNRLELLEQKLEMVLAPFTTLIALDGTGDTYSFLSEKTNFLSHSLQQLERIDSLSEQVGFLEERIGACSCKET